VGQQPAKQKFRNGGEVDPEGDWRCAFARIFDAKLFDHDWYAAEYPCTWDSGLSPLEHFVKYGAAMGRKPSPSPTPAQMEAIRRILRGEDGPNAVSEDPEHPLVSIICITYNQERYIEQTLDSMLAQRTSFPFEILAGDDCSSDGTADIIAEYAARDPRIVAVLRTCNVGPNPNFEDLARRARGRFVAICEGDDYWSDPRKLQKQVEFFNNHPEYTVCFHKVKVLHEDHPDVEEFFPERCQTELTLQQLARQNCIQTNSVMYRWRYGPERPFSIAKELVPGDWYTHLLQAKVGRIGYLDDVMAVYRRHPNGMWSPYATELARSRKYGNGELLFFWELKKHFGGSLNEHFQNTQKILFKRLAEAFLGDGDAQSLFGLISANRDICAEAMEELGFDPSTVECPDEPSLRAAVLEQSRISVIVTAYKHRNYIGRCLDSILAQEGLIDVRIIVGDDNSPDGTADIIADYAAKHPDKITFLRREENVGMLQNMKECLGVADGRYIAFCEGDDYWLSSRKLMKQISVVRPHRDVLMCFSWLLLELEATDSFVPHAEQSGLPDGEISFFTLASRPLTANFSCCFYRAEAISCVPDSYFEGNASADWLFNLYVANSGKVLFLKKLLSVYRIQSRGQWSGLPSSVQQSQTSKFKRQFSQIFGKGRGFEDFRVRVTARSESKSLPSGAIAAVLDWPPIDDWFDLADGYVNLRGWALSPGFAAHVIVSTSKSVQSVPLDGRRPDVIASFLPGVDPDITEITCGFSCPVQYESGLKLALDLEVDGSQHQWLTLEFEDDLLMSTLDTNRRLGS
jgi:glycosyltransferase involved in cell wall biosynthesis